MVKIQRAEFPRGLNITGEDDQPLQTYKKFLHYQEQIAPIDQAISQEERLFTQGEVERMLDLSQQKVELSEELLANGIYEPWMYRVQGEHLVREIRAIEFLQRFKGLTNADKRRDSLLANAQEDGLFELNHLVAQRAESGIILIFILAHLPYMIQLSNSTGNLWNTTSSV